LCKTLVGIKIRRKKIIRIHNRYFKDQGPFLDNEKEQLRYELVTKELRSKILLREIVAVRRFRSTFIRSYIKFRQSMWFNYKRHIHVTFLSEIKEWLAFETRSNIMLKLDRLPLLRGKRLYLIDISLIVSFFIVTYLLYFNPVDKYYLPIIFLAILYWNRSLFVKNAHRNIFYFLFYTFIYVKCGLVTMCISIFILYPLLVYTDFLRRPVY